MIYVFLGMGFEEIEALTTVDILRRAGMDVVTVGVGGNVVRGSHAITVAVDIADTEATEEGLEGIVLPGGMPGTLNLEHSPVVQHFLDVAVEKELWIAAICAAPSILGHRGLLDGRRAVCFPGYEQELTGATVTKAAVETDGRFITACGAGAAVDFALRIVSEMDSPERSAKLRASLQCR